MFSSLVSGIVLTNNHYNGRRGNKICRITPHYMEWYTSAKECCESFVPASRRASANYCIGKDGEIWGNVNEEDTAWTSGSRYNDELAITIECACYTDSKSYGILPDAVWASLVNLCVDICKRYNFRLNYTGSDTGNLTMHKWYQDTDCPGTWFSKQFGRLAKEVNAKLDGGHATIVTPDNAPMVFGGTYECKVNGLRVRTAPNLRANVVANYDSGDRVTLDDWFCSNDGYIWGRYVGATSNEQRFVAVGRATGKIEPDDYLIKI